MYSLRPYQREAVDAVYRHLREKKTNPCVVIPTAGGKSICLAEVAKEAVEKWGGRVMILAHVKELVEQNAAKLKSICPDLPVGVYSAGLGSRDTEESVIVAGIQSVYNKMDLFRAFDLIMVDEVHMVPPDGEGRYRTFLAAARERNPNVRLVGWTATPFRTQGGLICKRENLFNEICYEVGVKDLMIRGYISKMTARNGRARADLSHLHIRAGEFVPEDVEKAMGEDRVVRSACREIVDLTRERKTCLVFCTSVAHCRKTASLIEEYSGEECAVVTGSTPPEERANTIARLRGEKVVIDLFGTEAPPLKYCCNVAVMTTGTDIPGIDTVALLRPTNSPGLLIQMVGRGFRLSPGTGKTECLVLDYGKNIERFGPIDLVSVKEPRRMTDDDRPLVKECPNCSTLVQPAMMICPECGYQFPVKKRELPTDRLTGSATTAEVISSGKTGLERIAVEHTEYCVWEKRGAAPGSPKTLRISYYVDICHSYSEWICPEHTGYARSKFERWWREHALEGCPLPHTAAEAYEHALAGMIRPVKGVTLRRTAASRYPEIVDYEYADPSAGEGVPSGLEAADPDDIPF